jgi:protocatechuate 3,4-dioxygenase beta subunit
MILTGQVLDERKRPVRNTLVELWQANAAGRYVHKVDQHDAPLDPNFLGAGRCLTDNEGRYRFLTIKPGAYPWGNHPNAWRPQHIHLSLFGEHFASRLVTQMYFPGDPLLQYDPMVTGTPEKYRNRLIADFSLDITEENYALGYQFDIVLRGADETPFENR